MVVRAFIIAIMFLLITGCKVSDTQYSEPFRILEASSQEQVAGVQGGGTSVEYNFEAVMESDTPVQFDNVQINGQELKVNLLQNGVLIQNTDHLKRGDKLLLLVSSYQGGSSEHPAVPSTEAVADKAIIHFKINGVPASYTVANIKKLEPLILP